MAGYSGTPLAKKLGIKTGSRIWAKDAPLGYRKLLAPLPQDVEILTRAGKDLDLIHYFTKSRRELTAAIPGLMQRIKRDGMIWVSWPKQSPKIATGVTEGTIRDVALPLGLVDVKVCVVDETWSGLKLVIRKEHR